MMFDFFKNEEEKEVEKKEADFDSGFKEALRMALIISSDEATKQILLYAKAKIEVNMEKMNLLNPFSKKDQPKLTMCIAINKVYQDFIRDFEDMKQLAQQQFNNKPTEGNIDLNQ